MLTPEFLSLLGCNQSEWLMSPGERFAIIGLLSMIAPARVLEIGYRTGGGTEIFAKFASSVDTVDINSDVSSASKFGSHVRGWRLTSDNAFAMFLKEGSTFDLCVIDGSHEPSICERDLSNAILLSRVILLHDTMNLACRKAYTAALNGRKMFCELDWVEGRWQIDGLWGGLGLVLPSILCHDKYSTPVLFNSGDISRLLYSVLAGRTIK